MVSFNRFPADFLLPLTWIEFDASQMGTPMTTGRALLVGTMIDSGNATPGEPVPIGTADEAIALFGAGGQLTRMIEMFRRNNLVQQLWALPIAEPTGDEAEGSITVTGPATASGTIRLYVGGQIVPVAVSSGDAATAIATAIKDAVNATPSLPVTATSDNAEVTLTVKWAGTTGNAIRVFANYRGKGDGEEMPAGVQLAIVQPTGGTGDPDLAAALDALGEEPFEVVGTAFTDTSALNLYDEVWGTGDEGRWGWMMKLYGHVYCDRHASFSDHVTHGGTRNGPHVSIFRSEADAPSPPWEKTGARCGKILRSIVNDPARPLHSLSLEGIMAPKAADRFSRTERNTLALNGGATDRVVANVVQIEAPVTTYRVNEHGVPDNGQRYVEPMHTVAAVLRELERVVTVKYPRHKLANDGTRLRPGQAIVTPNVIRAELVAEYERLEIDRGWVENTAAFKNHLVVERDPQNPDRLNVLYPPDLVNQLRTLAVLAQPRLQFPETVA